MCQMKVNAGRVTLMVSGSDSSVRDWCVAMWSFEQG